MSALIRKSGDLSLDHKLREAKRFRGHVNDLLVDLGVMVDESMYFRDPLV